ncbi:hypothetical protein EK21DRAFT_111626 [Setomelanomma holmii]|uniref:Uncharacterized protein n=1 Tax=Setomelanomma holmii TaxID=210430 RepID=A0A9P4HAQ5_9PLEO|nr:hypothetical protein EK21DRAFT_111626 [Setomelanomma holmii]
MQQYINHVGDSIEEADEMMPASPHTRSLEERPSATTQLRQNAIDILRETQQVLQHRLGHFRASDVFQVSNGEHDNLRDGIGLVTHERDYEAEERRLCALHGDNTVVEAPMQDLGTTTVDSIEDPQDDDIDLYADPSLPQVEGEQQERKIAEAHGYTPDDGIDQSRWTAGFAVETKHGNITDSRSIRVTTEIEHIQIDRTIDDSLDALFGDGPLMPDELIALSPPVKTPSPSTPPREPSPPIQPNPSTESLPEPVEPKKPTPKPCTQKHQRNQRRLLRQKHLRLHRNQFHLYAAYNGVNDEVDDEIEKCVKKKTGRGKKEKEEEDEYKPTKGKTRGARGKKRAMKEDGDEDDEEKKKPATKKRAKGEGKGKK